MSTKQILVIDDNTQIRQMIQATLEQLTDWEVKVASSAQEGLSTADEQSPDAILLDLMMPEMDGVDCLKALRLNPKTREIPVIFLTAEQSLTEPYRFHALGAVGAIAKPFDPLNLAPSIEHTLGWRDVA
jgi:CheY-like chemotaxis protein